MQVCRYVCIYVFACVRCQGVCEVQCGTVRVRAARSQYALLFSGQGDAKCMIAEELTFSIPKRERSRTLPDRLLRLPQNDTRRSQGFPSHLSCLYVLTALWASVRLRTPSRSRNPVG